MNGEGITYLPMTSPSDARSICRSAPPNLQPMAGSPVISVIPARLAQQGAADGGIHGTAQIAGIILR
ncbi:MAG: hypothetical protein ACLUOF_04870 [Ruminococcus sp.]